VYPHQAERLAAAAEDQGLAALVAASAANVFYMTGFGGSTPGSRLAVWSPRGTALVVPASEVERVVGEGIDVDHLGAFGGAPRVSPDVRGAGAERIREAVERRERSAEDALAHALEALGVRDGRVGLDEGPLEPPAWTRAAARLAGMTVVPGGAALSTARRVKSPYEIECLARALAIAEEALNEVLQMLKPGVTEHGAAAVYEREVVKRGAAPRTSTIAFGERTSSPSPSPGERALKAGDLTRFDVGAVFKGYCSSVARTAVMGEPTERQAAAVEAVQAGLEAGIYAVKPGATAASVYDAVISRVRAAGLHAFQSDEVGHAIGLEPRERPALEAGEPTSLEFGEVLVVDVPYLEAGWGGVALRDTVLVTSTDSRVLNRSVRGLVVLD
jgi:Xaa-Pro aminopeptidase